MNRQLRAWQVSVALHLLLIGGFSLLGLGLAAGKRPVTIDLSFVCNRSSAAPAPAAAPETAPPPRPKPPPVAAVPPPEAVPVAAPETPEPAPMEPAVTETPAGSGPAAAPTDSASAAHEAADAYVREQFNYIRNRIMTRLDYPPLARRMGWSGQVVVAFLVLEDGSLEELRVLEGSGRDLLDENAVATVRSAAPFPPPPVAAEIIMPIGYRLN